MAQGTLFDDIDKNLLSRFKDYHINNPHVYQKFRDLAFKMRETGKRKYSAWTIINQIRWDHDLNTVGDAFQINNDFIALYARLLIYRHPEFANFFELRGMKAVGRKLSGEEKERTLDGRV